MPKKAAVKLDIVLPSPKKDAQAVAISELIYMYGEAEKLAKVLGESAFNIINWKRFGYVPFHKVGPVSRKLGVNMYLLNYVEVKNLLGDAPEWKTLVKEAGFSRLSLERILGAKEPK